jgi:hypothetical protein
VSLGTGNVVYLCMHTEKNKSSITVLEILFMWKIILMTILMPANVNEVAFFVKIFCILEFFQMYEIPNLSCEVVRRAPDI